MDAAEQVVLVERLGQVADDPGLQRARPAFLVVMGRDQDGGNGMARCDQATMKLEPGHPGHPDVRDQA